MKELTTERPNLFEPNVYISFYLTIAQIVETEALINAKEWLHNTCDTKIMEDNCKRE